MATVVRHWSDVRSLRFPMPGPSPRTGVRHGLWAISPWLSTAHIFARERSRYGNADRFSRCRAARSARPRPWAGSIHGTPAVRRPIGQQPECPARQIAVTDVEAGVAQLVPHAGDDPARRVDPARHAVRRRLGHGRPAAMIEIVISSGPPRRSETAWPVRVAEGVTTEAECLTCRCSGSWPSALAPPVPSATAGYAARDGASTRPNG
jgi:hypothetical protein